MGRTVLPFLGVALLTASALLSGCATVPPPTDPTTAPLTFALPPSTDDPTIAEQSAVVAELVAAATGREVEIQQPADYMAVVESVRSGFTDVAMTSQFATALAYENGSVTPIIVWDQEEGPASLCFVRADSDIRDLDDFAGGQIAFVDPASSSGHFLPKSLLVRHGYTEGRDYTATFAGSHEAAVLAMLNGTVDMACTARQLVPTYIEEGLLAEGSYRQVAETAPLPLGISVVVSAEVDENTRRQLTGHLPEALMADEELASLYGGAESYRISPDKSVYAPVLRIAREAGVELADIR